MYIKNVYIIAYCIVYKTLSYTYIIYIVVRSLQIDKEDDKYEIKGWMLHSNIVEEIRPIHLVRVGLIQHSIVLDTSARIIEQRTAITMKIESYIKDANMNGVNIVCLQEAWSTLCRILIILYYIQYIYVKILHKTVMK